LPADLVGVVAGVMKFQVGDRARWRADVLPVHPGHEADQHSDTRHRGFQVRSLVGDFRPVDLDETNIVRTRVET
jgi:hypothetical protein